MTSDQTKQKIEAFVEEEAYALRKAVLGSDDKYKTEELNSAALRRAILFGLELGKEAGPGKKMDIPEARMPRESAHYYNDALAAKNVAIQEMIDTLA